MITHRSWLANFSFPFDSAAAAVASVATDANSQSIKQLTWRRRLIHHREPLTRPPIRAPTRTCLLTTKRLMARNATQLNSTQRNATLRNHQSQPPAGRPAMWLPKCWPRRRKFFTNPAASLVLFAFCSYLLPTSERDAEAAAAAAKRQDH